MSKPVLEVGKIFIKNRVFTQQDVLKFIEVSGDDNPIHHDKEYAKTTIFKKPICHGILVTSLFSNLIGTTFRGCIYMSQSVKFLAPVYIDEEIEASIKIKEIDITKKYLYLQTQVTKEGSKLAIDGDAKVKLVDMETYLH